MSSSIGFAEDMSLPVRLLQYRDLSSRTERGSNGTPGSQEARTLQNNTEMHAAARFTAEEVEARVAQAKAEAAAEVEQRLRNDYEQKLQSARAPIAQTVLAFEQQSSDYFVRAEAEVIQLSLAIVRKILHREAQVDPMLVAALVRLALEKMREGSSVTIRVGTGRAASWRNYFSGVPNLAAVDVQEDATLSELDCVVDTELGRANFGLDAQLKEVEQGFFDLLALRPAER